MFTGLVEEVGAVKEVSHQGNSARMRIGASKVLEGLAEGDSISTNGVCLTVTTFGSNWFEADVMPETMRMSNLHRLKAGDRVNLERAMQAGDRFGGHIVSGHIDGTGRITGVRKEDNATWVEVSVERPLLKYMIHKGSVALDGISLTLAVVNERGFSVSIIPMTGMETTLLDKRVGDELNIECDVVGKYVERLMRFEKEGGGLTMDKLRENGFI